jgi:hypothetical protein
MEVDKCEVTGRQRRKDARMRFQPASLIADLDTDSRLDVAQVNH